MPDNDINKADAPEGFVLSRQLQLILGLFAATVAILAIVYLVFLRDRFELLYSDLRPTQAALIVNELDLLGVQYQLGNRGTNILVPSKQLDSTRLAIVGSEAPLQGLSGYELFDDSQMGLTDFAQRIKYLRALQGELARTIMMDSSVQSARVHIALPEKTAFRATSTQASAAVSLIVNEATFEPLTAVPNIKRLIAASVPELNGDNVSVINASGGLFEESETTILNTPTIRTDLNPSEEAPTTGSTLEETPALSPNENNDASSPRLMPSGPRYTSASTDIDFQAVSSQIVSPTSFWRRNVYLITGFAAAAIIALIAFLFYRWQSFTLLSPEDISVASEEYNEKLSKRPLEYTRDKELKALVERYEAMPPATRRALLKSLSGPNILTLRALITKRKNTPKPAKQKRTKPVDPLAAYSPSMRKFVDGIQTAKSSAHASLKPAALIAVERILKSETEAPINTHD